MLNNLLIVYQLLHAVQALEQQMGVAFADHEAKLGQQQEALAKQSQKGIATLQVWCPHLPPLALLYVVAPVLLLSYTLLPYFPLVSLSHPGPASLPFPFVCCIVQLTPTCLSLASHHAILSPSPTLPLAPCTGCGVGCA